MKLFISLRIDGRLAATMTIILLVACWTYAQTATADKDFQNGLKLYEETRFAEAAEAFKQTTKRDPSNAEAYYFLGNSYFSMYRDKDAIRAYKRVIELKPDHFLAYNNLGTAYHRLGDFKQAINSYEQALRVKPDGAEAIFGLGVTYLELKDKDAALEQHKRLAAIDVERADRLFAYINNKITLTVLNGKVLSLPKPIYPAQAKMAHASGAVVVWVSVDETGKVISASAVSGHPLLRATALQAAKLAEFSPTMLNGKAIRITGLIVYNFLAP